jgi:1,4-dihydroxy-6-naphthoate synthase
MASERLRIGISTCPNDTFAFHGLLAGEVEAEGLALDFELDDVEALNRGLLAGRFDVAKASFAAALELADETVVLPVGAALGRGVGPVVLAPAAPRPPDSAPLVLAPGEHTTAALLWTLFRRGEPVRGAIPQLRHVVFAEILPALARGEADLGLCIHEGRFTYSRFGLRLVEDLGATWEGATGLPLPLGGLLARRRLGPESIARVARAIRSSLDHARAHPERALPTLRRHAQEHSDEVLWKHVELYVTDETRDLSPEGRRALEELAKRAREAGLGSGAALAVAEG